MEVSHMKGLASHHGPESCLDRQQWDGEALIGENTGVLMSSENTQICRLTLSNEGESKTDHPETARNGRLQRSQRTIACVEAHYTGIGRPGKLPRQRQKTKGRRQ
ncbi:MAG: hypothetical protein C1942_00100 [Prosthecochloris sp.]|nr:hypothetical protein [Prosthecochloris sp.]